MLDPKKAGAISKGDTAAFLIGASVGGILDAVVNIAGFAEPMLFAGICGTGALGLKHAYDANFVEDDSANSHDKSDRTKK